MKEEKKQINISLTTAICFVIAFIILFSSFTMWYWAKQKSQAEGINKYAVITNVVTNV